MREFDVVAEGIKYEAKRDMSCIKTTNVAIEPQTLSHTKSAYYAYKVDGQPGWFFLPVRIVRWMYEKYPKKIGGDQGLPQALVPLKDFKALTIKYGLYDTTRYN